MSRPRVIGVTGGIATGKSTVLAALADFGAEVIDADRVYHDLIKPGMALNQALQADFGPTIVLDGGSIDRAALASLVFSDDAALARLDALTHPAVVAEIGRRIDSSKSRVVAVDAVKLIESGLDRLCDIVWIVTLDRAVQIERLMARNAISRADATRRVEAHRTRNDVRARSDATIDNSGSVEETRARVRLLLDDAIEVSKGE